MAKSRSSYATSMPTDWPEYTLTALGTGSWFG